MGVDARGPRGANPRQRGVQSVGGESQLSPRCWSPRGDRPSREPRVLSGRASSADGAGVAHGGQLLEEGGPHFSAPQRLWGAVVAQQEGRGLALCGAQERPERGQLREEEEESKAQRTGPATGSGRLSRPSAGSRGPAEEASRGPGPGASCPHATPARGFRSAACERALFEGQSVRGNGTWSALSGCVSRGRGTAGQWAGTPAFRARARSPCCHDRTPGRKPDVPVLHVFV